MNQWPCSKYKKPGLLLTLSLMWLVFVLGVPRSTEAYDNIITHTHIAKQAFYVWPNDTSHEIYSNLGMNYYDASTGDAACTKATTGTQISEGAKEEDDYDPLGQTCTENYSNLAYGFYHHFFNPDLPDPNGLQNALVGYGWHGALWQAQAYWNQAKVLYSIEPINQPLAYWYLGRIAHLLADVSVPAHVLNDSHAKRCVDGEDSYEFYSSLNFLNYTSNRVTNFNQLPTSLTLNDLFTQSALHTVTYPSDNVDGKDNSRDSWNNNIEYCGGGIPERYISNEHLKEIADDLIPQAIKYTAALYRLFWQEFHVDIEITVNGQIRDVVDIFQEAAFKALGKINDQAVTFWEWDFNYNGSTFNPMATGQQVGYVFKSWGQKTVALRATTNGAVHYTTHSIQINPPPIYDGRPDGCEAKHIHFSTTDYGSLVTEYTWYYGDGTPPENGGSQEHTYANEGSYNVTLVLTLANGSETISNNQPTYVGSGTQYISSHTIYGEETWSCGSNYVVDNISVANGGKLTIQPGVSVEYPLERFLYVSGTLVATGVTFRWDGTNRWRGIYFSGAGSNASRLENCVLEGSRGASDLGAVIAIYDASPTIKGCTIENSGNTNPPNGIGIKNGSPVIQGNTIRGSSSGIYIDSTSSPVVTGNTITNNQQGIYVYYSTNNPVFSSNIYSDNAFDLIAGGTIQGAVNWDDASNMVYGLQFQSIPQGSSLIIAAGPTLVFGGNQWLSVSGTLIATGVKFTTRDQVNPWSGIAFNGTGSKDSRLENCVLEHANGSNNDQAVIYVKDTSPTIKECTINKSDINYGSGLPYYGIRIQNGSPVIQGNTINGINSGAYGFGIYVDSTSSPGVTGNTITNNWQGIYVDGGGGTYQGNTISGNVSYGFYYSGSTVLDATNSNWGDPSGPLDDSDDRATGGLYNPNGKGNKVSDHVNYYPWQGMSTTGTIIINSEPADMNTTSPWSLTGPNSYNQTGTGDQTFNDLYPGDYTLTWGDVTGWSKPSPASSTQNLSSGGSITFNGNYSASTYHPADTTNDYRIVINECTSYGFAWKTGATWSVDPNPIPIGYMTNACYLWKIGEVYHYDSGVTPPYVTGVQ